MFIVYDYNNRGYEMLGCYESLMEAEEVAYSNISLGKNITIEEEEED